MTVGYFISFPFFFSVSESVVNDDNNDGCKGLCQSGEKKKTERNKEGKKGLECLSLS